MTDVDPDGQTLTITEKTSEDKSGYGPLRFSGEPTELLTSSDKEVTLLMKTEAYMDGYKTLYGHADCFYNGYRYYSRVKHTICGDLLVGCFVRFNESDYVFGGVCDSSSKKKSWNALLLPTTRNVEGLKLISVPLSKSISLPQGGIRFAEPDYLSHLERVLSEKTDRQSAS